MKTDHTAKSSEGLRFPFSRQVLGAAVLQLGLRKEIEKRGFGSKMIKRFFDGASVSAEQSDEIVEAIVDTLVPDDVVFGGTSDPLRGVIAAQLPFYMKVWDAIAAEINANSYPVAHKADLVLPVLRLTALDVGIRWGAWASLRYFDGEAPAFDSDWVAERPLGLWIERTRDSAKSYADLADEVDVSIQALDAWRSGRAVPADENLYALASVLTSRENVERLHFELRLRSAVQAWRHSVVELCGPYRIDDMMRAMRRSAELIYEWFCGEVPRGALLRPVELRIALLDTICWGARAQLGRGLSMMLSERAFPNQELAADLVAVGRDWLERVSYWTRRLGAPAHRPELVAEELERRGLPGALVPQVIECDREVLLSMSGFDFKVAAAVRNEQCPEDKANNRAIQAEIAMSIGDLDAAIDHLHRAIEYMPKAPMLHFRLGVALGIAGNRYGAREAMDEGLRECHLTVALDPEFGNARNEIAIILANLRRHDEAEEAYAKAEPYYGEHAHHWRTRGTNYVALGRLDEAVRAFERAIEIGNGKEQVVVMARLAAALMARGERGDVRAAKGWGAKVRRLRGDDPTERWEAELDVWNDARDFGPR